MINAGIGGINLEPADDEQLKEWEQRESRIHEENCKERFKQSGVPRKFLNVSFESFETSSEQERHVKEVVENYAKNPKNRVLILCGNNGNGKTHLGTAVLKESIWAGNGGRYITSSNLCIKYESAIGFKTDMSRAEIVEDFSECAFLVIDECCKYFVNSEMEKFLLVQIICNRYENGLPTVLITNAGKKDFIDFLGKAVYDRFTEVCTTLDFNWESRRKGNRDEEIN